MIGILIGGDGSRMGGVAKGLLAAAPGERSIVERSIRQARRALPGCEVTLVGDRRDYDALGIGRLSDSAPDGGPLAGLVALARRAVDLEVPSFIALACDMPYVTAPLFERLARHEPVDRAVAPRVGGVWQPLFARYPAREALDVARKLLDSKRRALHRVLEVLEADELALTVDEARTLRDWDAPEDVR